MTDTLRMPETSALRTKIRGAARGARSMEQVAQRVVETLYQEVRSTDGGALALVRFFKTHPYADLPAEIRSFADGLIPEVDKPAWLRCLTLLATTGDLPDWRARRSSTGHQAIPLASEEMVRGAPMISQLILQFGIPISAIVGPPNQILVTSTKTFGIFHVADALGSPHIPAQAEFVEPHAIKSVVGFGGLLPSGDLWSVIMFSKVRISREVAESFQPIASSLTVALIPVATGKIFSSES